MTNDANTGGILEEALERLHAAGPEIYEWRLTNHAPMVVEALAY
ncbi:hypothetical protein [Streptomyces sp. NPDC058653]